MSENPEELERSGEDQTPVADPRPLPEAAVMADLIEPFADAAWELSSGQDVVLLPRAQLLDFAGAAKAAGFEMCVDVTAVDHHRARRDRFELVVNLVSLRHGKRLRLRLALPAEDPRVPSLVSVYPGANFFEREVFDMFGISFDDHPDMTRILMPDDWQGHPLRKDFGVGSVPVQFKESHQIGRAHV